VAAVSTGGQERAEAWERRSAVESQQAAEASASSAEFNHLIKQKYAGSEEERFGPTLAAEHQKGCGAGPNFFTSLRTDSSRFGMIPNDRTSPSGSASATAMVSAWTSNPKNRTFFMEPVPFRLWLCVVVTRLTM